nr:MAG TPA: hypothetical protein [Caudoviricetes sp.]
MDSNHYYTPVLVSKFKEIIMNELYITPYTKLPSLVASYCYTTNISLYCSA